MKGSLDKFKEIRRQHGQLLRSVPQSAEVSKETVEQVQEIISEIISAGREVGDQDERDYLQNLLSFWGNWMYSHTRSYPSSQLEPYLGVDDDEETEMGGVKDIREPLDVKDHAGWKTFFNVTPSLLGTKTRVDYTKLLRWVIGAMIGLVVIVIVSVQVGKGILPNDPTSTKIPQKTEDINAPNSTATPLEIFPTLGPLTQEPAVETEIVMLQLPNSRGVSQGMISVQLIAPAIDQIVKTGKEFEVGIAFFGMQPEWKMFYFLTNVEDQTTAIFPASWAVKSASEQGIWTAGISIKDTGLYTVGVVVTTSKSAYATISRLATGEFKLKTLPADGIIVFSNLGRISGVK